MEIIATASESSVSAHFLVVPEKVSVPLDVELPPDIALNVLKDVGLVAKFTGETDGTWVKRQAPVAGTLVSWGSTVTLELAVGPIP